jgi:hypothetical protein
MKIFFLIIIFTLPSFANVFYYSHGKKIVLTELKQLRNLDKNIKYYQNESGQKVGVTQEILTKCKKGYSCKEIFLKYNLSDITNLTSTIILITLKNGEDPFEVSQKLSLEKNIKFAHPNFIKKKKTR